MRRSLSQESLKLIACVTMLLDHIGAVFLPGYYTYYALRILGRLSFPIYCFLLVEGAHHTRNPSATPSGWLWGRWRQSCPLIWPSMAG